MNESTELLAVRVAELYYEENKSQDEIGGLLGMTRWKVGRLLSQARERGIVSIEIVHPRARRLGLERHRMRAQAPFEPFRPTGGPGAGRPHASSEVAPGRSRPRIRPPCGRSPAG